ncbi:MAG TPA: glycosyltransferase family 2 protein [Sandaracinaceae bacterium LLY-WYZ-13_1]|nr:glycosyltransferase family 2 protein [Sandaracinaceae bacterium LLY-WYZ-13_1]
MRERPTLSVVMPAYNERETIHEALRRVLEAPVDSLEVVVVDDGSTDGTRELLTQGPALDRRVRVVLHDVNRGKGAALRTGFSEARGRFVVVQDADLEYDPNEYPTLLGPLLDGHADVVYGSRFAGGGPHRVLYYWHSVANQALTTFSNMITDLNLTDMETCYKAFRREVLDEIQLREDRFGIEPEMTAKVSQLGVRVYEVPISYHGRTYAEGKKIGLRDAFRAIYCIVRYGVPARAHRRRRPWSPPNEAPPTTENTGETVH